MATSASVQPTTQVEVLTRPSPFATAAAFLAVDTVCLLAAPFLSFHVWQNFNPEVPQLVTQFWPTLLLFWVLYGAFGLYPAIGMTPVEEFRRVVLATSLVYLLLTAGMFVMKDIGTHSRGVFILAGAISIFLVPFGRAMLCHFCSGQSWFGAPVVILGAGRTGAVVVRQLRTHRAIGLKPVACLDDDSSKWGNCEGVPVIGGLSLAQVLGRSFDIHYAILAIPSAGREQMLELIETCSSAFRNVIVVPDLFGMSTLWVASRDLGGILGLELRHNLLVPLNRATKRLLDICIGILAFLFAAPIIGLAAAWVRLASRGPAFYYQAREGEKESIVHLPKLRTMHQDAEVMLLQHLASDSDAEAEWNKFCKLKNDPRIIPGIGKLLRRTSLDELPQLWCVLKGEMSLVGPRPFPAYHNEKFPPEFRALRRRVKPGITGLWQISDRSNGDLTVQQKLDTYYIKNWSIWLDLYILSRTVRAVLFPNGAY
ncbi:MAG: undecaprenyl-phosphate galactose phosphotransferase WbaP [Bryobacterales bacterium]|nr:undecaprenyl-phosphate galactose phosphotransferase WbaP [Bryobacterales bacterium]